MTNVIHRLFQYVIAVALAAILVAGCDGPTLKPSISPAQQQRWDELQAELERSSLRSRVELFEEYVEDENAHPKFVSEARAQLVLLDEEIRRIEALRAARDGMWNTYDSAVTDDRSRAFDEGDLELVLQILASHLATTYRNLLTNDLFPDGGRDVVSTRGPIIDINSPARLDLRSSRVALRKALNSYGGAKLENDCQERCLNTAVNSVLSEKLGGSFFQGAGRIDAALFDRVAGAVWMEPDEKIFGIPAQNYYDVLRKVPRDLMTVRKAIERYDEAKSTRIYRALRAEHTEPFSREIWKFYFFTPRQNGMLQDLEKEVDPTRLHIHYGFWHRRIYDRSEPVVVKWLEKTLETYDPEFHAEVTRDSEE